MIFEGLLKGKRKLHITNFSHLKANNFIQQINFKCCS